MNSQKFYTSRVLWLVVLLGIVGLIAAFYSFNGFIYNQKQGDGSPVQPYRASLSGEYVCLPHTNTEGPQTLECAFGLKTDVGEYYGINFMLMSQTHEPVQVGQRISANGVITPAEDDYLQKYPVEGIFSVTDSLEILENDEGPTQATVSLGNTITIVGVTIAPQEVVSDSRCPTEVVCVWAGTVEVRTTLSTPVANGEHVLKLGQPQTFGQYAVTLVEVSPIKTQDTIPNSQYQFIYKVSK